MVRVETPVTFTAEEAERIKQAVRTKTPDLHCPRCDHDLAYGPGVRYEGHTIRELYCPVCHRCLMIRDFETADDREHS